MIVHPRRRHAFLLTLTLVTAALWAGPALAQSAFSFGTTVTSAPTGEKPESKLWWTDGSWWGTLFNAQANEYRIFRFDAASGTWSDTGTAVDTRTNSKADTLWDEETQRLYVVSHVFSSSAASSSSSSNWGRLYRYTYNAATDHYALDSGFPAVITRGTAEALTIARDSTQRLWVTWVEAGKVKINWSRSTDLDWGTPVDIPVSTTAATVTSDDVSAVIAFGGRLGVMWSNQLTSKVYFAVRYDTDAPGTWQPLEVALPRGPCSGACADDHINLKTDAAGQVYAAVKTSLTASTAPIVMLLVRRPAATWEAYTVATTSTGHTRPIVLLDEEHGWVYVCAAAPDGGGTAYLKFAPLEQIEFVAGAGQAFIKSSTNTHINNPTSTKQNVNASTGLLVLAGDSTTRVYVQNFQNLTGPPIAAPAGLAAATFAAGIVLTWSDASNNESGFDIERAAGAGTFATIATVGTNVTTYADATPIAGTEYTYRVRARNSAGWSRYSNAASGSVSAAAGQRIKDMTFEAGSLTGADGADAIGGGVSIETAAPVKGSYSVRVPGKGSSVPRGKLLGGERPLPVFLRPRERASGIERGASAGDYERGYDGRQHLPAARRHAAAARGHDLHRLAVRAARGGQCLPGRHPPTEGERRRRDSAGIPSCR